MDCENRGDFGAFIPSLLDDYPLDVFEFRIFARIARRSGSASCFESLPNMAKSCKMSLAKARIALRLLVAAGLIEIQERLGTSKLCWINNPSKWVTPEQVEKIRKTLTPKSKRETPIESDSGIGSDRGGGIGSDRGVVSDLIDEGSTIKDLPIKVLPIKEEEAVATKSIKVEIEFLEPEESFVDIQDLNDKNSTNENDTQQDSFSAAADTKILKEIEQAVYDWRRRPWMQSATTFKPEVIKAVWQCNVDWYSLLGSKTPNLKKISDRLRSLNSALSALNPGSITAWEELQNYWTTAKAISNPQVEQAFTQIAAQAKHTSLQVELETRKQRIGAAIADL